MRRLNSRLATVSLLTAATVVTAGCSWLNPLAAPSGSASSEATSWSSALQPPPGPSDTATDQTPSCAQLASTMTLNQKVGQLYLIGVQGEIGPQVLALVQETQAGAVILMGPRNQGVASTRAATDELVEAAGPQASLIVATDQEGGLVQRLSGPGFSTIPPAATQASYQPDELRRSWQGWGAELSAAGVRLNLAPVVDVVPAEFAASNEPISRLERGYGDTADKVTASSAAVIRGMQDVGVASSAKHFPGIGRTTTNTDLGIAHDTVTTGTADELAAFRGAIDAGVSSVMISSVVYDQIDAQHPAVFSSVVMNDLLRGRLGYRGVVVSDDLGVAKAVAAVPSAERGTRFLLAGGDLVTNVDQASVAAMVKDTSAKAQNDEAFAGQLEDKVARVLALKASVGLVDCQVG